MIQIIAIILFLIGLLGMSFIVIRAIPRLESLEKKPLEVGFGLKKGLPKIDFSRKIKELPYLKDLKIENVIKKMLLKIKIFFLKCENRIDIWLKRVSYSKKFNDDYWDKIKKR
jgi:hypothetical protein